MKRAKSVKAEMLIPSKVELLKRFNLRNAYQMKLEREYNSGKSVLPLKRVKIYAELNQIQG